MNEQQDNPLEVYGVEASSFELIRLDPIRRAVAQRLTESAQSTPHFALQMPVNFGALIAARQTINARPGVGNLVSLNDLIVRACGLALRAHPEVNVSFTTKGIAYHRSVDVAVAIAVKNGLITPIVRNADEKTVDDICAEIKSLGERARLKRLAPSEYRGGTFCVSNLGMYGVTSFTSILNPPHACILSVGAVSRVPIMKADAVVGADLVTLTLNCDHRVVDGAVGAKFLGKLKDYLEQPENWLREQIVETRSPVSND